MTTKNNGSDATHRLISTDYMELIPAYGRNYTRQEDVIHDFQHGLDFKGDYSIGFAYCSVRDFAPGTIVLLRYNRLRSVTPALAKGPSFDATILADI